MAKSINTRTKYVLIGSDFSQQEPRLLSHYSQDENMITAYKQGKDLYATIASGVYKMGYWDCMERYEDGSPNPEGKKRRQSVKAILLGIMYGRGARAIAEQINSTVERAQEIVDDFYKSFPSVKTWMDDSLKKLKEKEYVEDFCGRRRRLPDINLPAYKVSGLNNNGYNKDNFNPFIMCKDRETDSLEVAKWKKRLSDEVTKSQAKQRQRIAEENIKRKAEGKPLKVWKENDEVSNAQYEKLAKEALKDKVKIEAFTGRRSQAERQCVNAMIQGGAASMTKIAMNKIHRDPILNQYGFKMLIGVHDELIGQCKEEYKDICADRLCEVMKTCVSDIVDVPFKCDPSVVRRWYEDEMGYSIQDKVQNLIKEGKTEEEAIAIIRKKNPEFNEEQFQTLLTIE
jgi:DNA polymerase I-like protein with 3'-5' exonuclease and polymerase domains